MGFATPNGVSFCLVGEQPIFLDLLRDRYFALAPEAGAAFARLVSGAKSLAGDERHIATLVLKGLLIESDDDSTPVSCRHMPPATRSALDGWESVRSRGRWLSIGAILSARARLRVFGLRHSLGRILRRKRGLSAGPGRGQLPDRLVRSFRAADLTIGSLDLCVPRSIAFMSQALGSGYAPDLIVGVRLRPFAAHCWVQQDGVLLNERVDVARDFTPILVI